MTKLQRLFAGLMLLLVTIPVVTAQPNPDKQEWIPLFNGKDLSGWDIKIAGQALNDNYKNTFRVEDGVLRIMYDQYKNFDAKYGHLYYKTPFSYYIVRFTYRFTGNQTPGGAVWNVRNSGIMIHSQSAKSLSFGQDFPVSLEVQLLGGLNKGDRHTANLCTPGTQVHTDGKLNKAHCIDSDSKTYDGDQWVDASAIVLGDSVIHHLIGKDTVLTYTKPEVSEEFISKDNDWKASHIDNIAYWATRANTPLKEGYIALQAESHPIDFRTVEVLNLMGCTDPNALNYKSYYVKPDNTQCRYKK